MKTSANIELSTTPIHEIPRELICPITHQISYEPVLCVADGYTYELEVITKHMQSSNQSPMNRMELIPEGKEKTPERIKKILIPNRNIADSVSRHLSLHPEHSDDQYIPEQWTKNLAYVVKTSPKTLKSVQEYLSKGKRLLSAELEPGYSTWDLICQYGASFMVEGFLNEIKKPENKKQLDKILQSQRPSNFQPEHANCALRLYLNQPDRTEFNDAELYVSLGAELDQTDQDGNTLIHNLVKFDRDRQSSIAWIVKKNAELLNRPNKSSNTPLLLAILENKTEMFIYLKEDLGADTSIANNDNCTPLIIALQNSNTAILKHLLSEEQLKLENLPLHLFIGLNDISSFKIMLEFIKMHNPERINAKDKYNNTALHLAAKLGKDQFIEILLNEGANYKIKNADFKTASKLACDEKKLTTVNLMAEIIHKINSATELEKKLKSIEESCQQLREENQQLRESILNSTLQLTPQYNSFIARNSNEQANVSPLQPLSPDLIAESFIFDEENAKNNYTKPDSL